MSIGLVPDPGTVQLPNGGGIVPDEGSIQQPTPQQPGSLEALGRGALQGATLGYSDEISGAIESLFSDKPYVQARDEARAANNATKDAHPFLYGAGEVGGGIASAFVPGLGVAKGATVLRTAATLGLQGAAAGLGGSDASLVGPNQDIGGAAKDTVVGGIIGAGVGAASTKLGQLVKAAPEQARLDRVAAVAQGEGKAGSATTKLKKLLDKDPEAVDKALTTGFTSDAANGGKKAIALSEIMRAPAKEVLPVVEERLDQVGSRLDPLYKQFDKAEGGLSLHNFINHVDNEVQTLSKTPLNEKYVEALEDIKQSALKAWSPEMMDKIRGNAKAAAAGLDSPVFKDMEDVKIPYQDFRAMVTRLQKRGSNVINPLNPGEASQMKADLAKGLKEFLNADLERVAENHSGLEGAAAKLQDINREYSALSNIYTAVEQRGWKENAGNTSAKGIAHGIIGHGSLAAGIAGAAMGHPAALLIPVAAKTAEAAPAVRRSATQVMANVHGKLAELATRAAAGDAQAKSLLSAIHSSPEIAARLAALHSHTMTELGQ